MYKPNTLWTWAFMIVAIFQAIVVLALESYVFARFQMALTPGLPPVAKTKVIPTYLTLFIFGFVYELVLVYDSLRLKNTIQVIGLCLYNLGMLIYSSVQVKQIQEAVFNLYKEQSPSYLIEGQLLWPKIKPYLVAIPILIGIGTVSLAFIAWKLYDEFAWTIYKHISADLRMKRRFLAFQVSILYFVMLQNRTNRTLDLHRTPQIRFLLLPRIYRAILSRRHGCSGDRILPDLRSNPNHHHHPGPCCGVDTAGDCCRHVLYHRTLLLRARLLLVQAGPHLSAKSQITI